MFLEGTLPAEDGAALKAALQRASKEIPRDERARDREGARMADALVALVTSGGSEAARRETTLVIHADAAVLAGAPSAALAETEAGDRLPADAVRRLACEARIDWVLERDGDPVKLGTQGRKLPERLRRALVFRDRGCRFPGCEARRYVDGHHIVHWADGGPTTLDNLVMLCGAHHRLIHEAGWRISGHPDRDLRFHDPTGRRLRAHPEPLARARAPAPLGG
ncbi:MAG TPA: DUF222 domain-containing protein [Actinomycetota bacterium]|nr:DUF222 domain-containing protein [Actinomycetota bacterium]